MSKETPVVYWKSVWIVLKGQFEYKIDQRTKEQIAIPKTVLIGVERNKEYFREN